MSAPPLHPGLVLKQRFLEPLGLSASALSHATGMPRSRLSLLLAGRRGITADTAHRLALAFGTAPQLWMDLQTAWELAQHAVDPTEIAPLRTEGFLIGPEGATPIPPPRPHSAPSALVRVSAEARARIMAQAALLPPAAPHRHTHVTYPDGQQAWVSQES